MVIGQGAVERFSAGVRCDSEAGATAQVEEVVLEVLIGRFNLYEALAAALMAITAWRRASILSALTSALCIRLHTSVEPIWCFSTVACHPSSKGLAFCFMSGVKVETKRTLPNSVGVCG